MIIKRDSNMFRTQIDDKELATWLDGEQLYYDLPKDSRPNEYSPVNIDDAMQSFYQIERLANRKSSSAVNESIDSLKELAEIYTIYSRHVLGLIIKEQYKD